MKKWFLVTKWASVKWQNSKLHFVLSKARHDNDLLPPNLNRAHVPFTNIWNEAPRWSRNILHIKFIAKSKLSTVNCKILHASKFTRTLQAIFTYKDSINSALRTKIATLKFNRRLPSVIWSHYVNAGFCASLGDLRAFQIFR